MIHQAFPRWPDAETIPWRERAAAKLRVMMRRLKGALRGNPS